MKRKKKILDPIDKVIAANIRKLREQKGWSQTELGRRCGDWPQSHVSQIEKGRRGLGRPSLFKLAAAFGIEVQDLWIGGDLLDDGSRCCGT